MGYDECLGAPFNPLSFLLSSLLIADLDKWCWSNHMHSKRNRRWCYQSYNARTSLLPNIWPNHRCANITRQSCVLTGPEGHRSKLCTWNLNKVCQTYWQAVILTSCWHAFSFSLDLLTEKHPTDASSPLQNTWWVNHSKEMLSC